MTDEDLKQFKNLLKESLQPLQGEVSRLTTESRKNSSQLLRIEHETSKNGRETARLSSDMENMKEWLMEELTQVNDKLDALTGDVIDLQNNVGVIRDQFVGVNEKLEENKVDIHKIKKHIGLPLS